MSSQTTTPTAVAIQPAAQVAEEAELSARRQLWRLINGIAATSPETVSELRELGEQLSRHLQAIADGLELTRALLYDAFSSTDPEESAPAQRLWQTRHTLNAGEDVAEVADELTELFVWGVCGPPSPKEHYPKMCELVSRLGEQFGFGPQEELSSVILDGKH